MIERRRFDITKTFLYAFDEDSFVFDYENKTIGIIYEYEFHPDFYFGTHINSIDGRKKLDFMSVYDIESKEIYLVYWGSFDGGKEEYKKKLSEKEKLFFRKTMNECCADVFNCSLEELIKEKFMLEVK